MSKLIKIIWKIRCQDCDFLDITDDVVEAETTHRDHLRQTSHNVDLFPTERVQLD